MNEQQVALVKQAEESIKGIRRTLSELDSFGWKATEPNKALSAFDKQRRALDSNQDAIANLSPLEKDHKAKLSTLLSEENYTVESLSALARDAQAALTDEELSFFDARQKFLESSGVGIAKADSDIRLALVALIAAMQERWGLMIKRQELAQRFMAIHQMHNTEESFHVSDIQIGKPFPKMNQGIWLAFVASFLGRVKDVFGNCETTTPEDAVRTIYER